MANPILIISISTLFIGCNFAASLKNEFDIEVENGIPFKDLTKVENLERAIMKNLIFAQDNHEYWLFTRNNPTIPQIIQNGNPISLWTSNYDSNKPLKVIAHGWNRDGTSAVNTEVTSAFLNVEDVNIIVVDWRESASGDYFDAASRVPAAGQFLGNFLNWVINTGGGNWDKVHLIGYSLGAHLVGNAGRQVGGRPIRVTGLDPAGPFWSNPFALNKQSGRYVEVIHTNILVRGITEPIGHVDFYPNGGQLQPGCENTDDPNRCSHSRAYELFASSIKTNHFVGRQCTDLWQAFFNQCSGSTLNMGNGILSKTGNGIYSLSTGSSSPF